MDSSNKLQSWLEDLCRGATPDFEECCSYLAVYFPLLNEMAVTEQDSEWHAEGNVAIHTDLVLTELYELLADEADHISGQQRQALILSALLHDIGKPLVTREREIDGVRRVIAPRHEEVGESYLMTRLIELPLQYRVIKTVMELVKNHQSPKMLVVKNRDYRDYLKLALNASPELLYWLEVADIRGRRCSDSLQNMEYLELFRLFSQEHGLWQSSDPLEDVLQALPDNGRGKERIFIRGYAAQQLMNGEISTIEEAPAKNYVKARNYSNLYVMCGISGSGKSTWIEQNLKGCEIISLDEIRKEINGKRESQKNRGQVIQLAKTRLKAALAAKKDIVWDATNIRKDFRKIVSDIGENYGALITLVVFQIKQSTLRENDRNRKYTVGDEVISNQINRFEWPANTEAHRMIIVGEKSAELHRVGAY